MRTDGTHIIQDIQLDDINIDEDEINEDKIVSHAGEYLRSLGIYDKNDNINDYSLIALPQSLYIKLLNISRLQHKSFSKTIEDSLTQ